MEEAVATKLYPEWDREFDYGLEIIQTLLWQINFGNTDWGYLAARGPNEYSIISRKPPLPVITETPWCPLVEERDIKITNWVCAEDRNGVWNGKEVDLFVGWEASNVKFLQRMMAAYKLLIERNLEHLAYRALGHVVRDGTADICGIMTEAAHGRMVEHKDKSAVYKAIAQIERSGLVFRGITPDNIMITEEGYVRLRYICGLARQPFDAVERTKELEYWHWEQLELVFNQLARGPNMFPPMRNLQTQLLSLPQFPVPTRGMALHVYVLVIVHAPDPREQAEAGTDNRRRVQRAQLRRAAEMLVFDAPVSAQSLRVSRPRLLVRATVPYEKPDKLVQELLRAQNWTNPNRTKRLTQ
ncbi:hypothetical protein B0H17DRAFT_1049417 [Mycena rosella]|uniref:Uncharacterized protein n=1 Tax=Mycena rosella TaxID=1033263 RepID=A0AAD7DTF7_MYCRO|nr:hypothetical protein B0H17DRAFT_1049417 [Mycena rosella]